MRLFERLVPPLVYSAVRNLYRFRSLRSPAQFAGVTNDRSRLPPIDRDAFQSDNWIKYQSIASAEHSLATYHSHEVALQLLCAQMGSVDIFDLGGGPAVLHLVARSAARSLNYVVLENERLCAVGRSIHPEVRFFSDATDAIKATRPGGIALCVSTLQYCLEWESTLDLLVSCKPRYVMIGRHYTPPNGQIFYAIQTIYATTGYCGQAQIVFLPKGELIRAMRQRGYDLLCDIPLHDASYSLRGTDRATIPALFTRNLVFVSPPQAS